MLFYIASHLSYKPCPDRNIYKTNQLESTFVEIIKIKPKKINIVLDSLCKYPNMDDWADLLQID